MPPIPIPQCGLHSATLAAQWWAVSTLLPPPVARGPRSQETETRDATELEETMDMSRKMSDMITRKASAHDAPAVVAIS